jgi:hypothetical protein
VGVYLPLSSSSPIFIGGLIRWLVDLYLNKKNATAGMTREQQVAESDRSPGVLLASGYIAGGALAGIGIAFMEGAIPNVSHHILNWSKLFNPFFEGQWSNVLSLIPFAILGAILFLTGRDILFRARPNRPLRR